MDLYPIIGCALLGAGTVALVIPLILRLAKRYGLGRGRDFHHTHKERVPRFGGLALAVAFLAVEFFVALLLPAHRSNVPGRLTVILGSLAMFAVGFWDDLQALGAKRKLLAQVGIALCVDYAGLGIDSLKLPLGGQVVELGGWGMVFTVVWLVGITNLMNLIDGVDGLAGGIGLMLMALLVYVGYQNGTFVFLTAGVTGSLLAFLWFNFPPARIYLGDGGAYLVGFQIAVFSLVGSHKGTVVAALIAPLFVLALPIVDTSLAILRRGFRGLPLFRPDRRHIHHRLLATGMSRRKVVLSLYAVTLIFLVIGFAACWSRGQLMPVLLGVGVLVLLVGAGRLSLAREWLAVGRNFGNSLAVRQEVQYALSLSNWLQHEGDRCASLDELFADLVFAGRRLGFSSIELHLADGKRAWSLPARCRGVCFDQEVNCGDFGVLRMRAAGCLKPGACVGQGPCQVQHRSGPPIEPDVRRSEILAELLAEGWVKAAARWRTQRRLDCAAPAAQVVGGEQGLGRAERTSGNGRLGEAAPPFSEALR
ncbi:MAG TPA: MraY family glycosyltransferase [Verrucomicrobiae bacterium]